MSGPDLPPEPGSNHGFIRLNWQEPAQAGRKVLMFAPPESDAAEDVVDAASRLGIVVDIWQLSSQRPVKHSSSVREIERLYRCSIEKGAETSWVGVMPFDLHLVRMAEKRFPNAAILLLTDDPVALWLGGESPERDLRESMFHVGRAFANLSVYAASTRRELMMISLRKAKEFPQEVLHAFCQFCNHVPDGAAINDAINRLGRAHSTVALRPIQKALEHVKVQGAVNVQSKFGRIGGWAKIAMSSDRVEIKVLIRGEEVARTLADELRQDLLTAGVGDGRHGFDIDITPFLSSETVRVEVRSVEGDVVLGHIDMTLERGLRVVADVPSKLADAG